MLITGSYGAFPSFDNLVSRKWVVVERNSEILRSVVVGGLSSQCLQGNFCQLDTYGYSGVIQCISNFRQIYILKTAGRRAKHSEIGPRGSVCSEYMVLLTVKCLRSFWGHLLNVHFLYLQNGRS